MRAGIFPVCLLIAIAVVLPLHLMQAREAQRDEAAAFGRGLIAGSCRTIADRWPTETERPPDVRRMLAECEPYLAELDRRTGGEERG